MAGKEYTTAPILVNADGHPIPQYLDITDTTDSPQGTFKPLTQLQAEHPDVQNVQLTGSSVAYKDLVPDIGIVPAGASKSVSIYLTDEPIPYDKINLIGRLSVGGTFNIKMRSFYFRSDYGIFESSMFLEKTLAKDVPDVFDLDERINIPSVRFSIIVENTGELDIEFRAFTMYMFGGV